jgi:hypothetical protein
MNDSRAAHGPFAKPGHAVAEQGIVLLDGPDGIAVSMTADAAEDTGKSLMDAADAARKQTPPLPSRG